MSSVELPPSALMSTSVAASAFGLNRPQRSCGSTASNFGHLGAEIADRTFLLSSVVYISSGTGRKLERFRMVWPERQETVSGGTIRSGDDPDQPPVAEGVTTIGADPDEGVPYEGPATEPLDHGVPRHCLASYLHPSIRSGAGTG